MRKEKENTAEKEKKGRKPFTKKQKILIGIEIGVGSILLALAGTLVWINTRQVDIVDTTIAYDERYTKENIAKTMDEEFIPMMEFRLYGEYTGTDSSENEEYDFAFCEDNRYLGFSEVDEDDFGTYHITSDGETYYLTITCNSTTDVYTIEFLDGGQVMLTNEKHVFLLLPKEE